MAFVSGRSELDYGLLEAVEGSLQLASHRYPTRFFFGALNRAEPA